MDPVKQRKIKVLVVDDDPAALLQSKKKIELYVPDQYILTAENSVEIMRILKSEPIDLAFLDVEMLDTDGFRVADYLKECQPKAKYVFLTGHVEFGAKSYDYEPIDFLCKPVDAVRLLKTFERFDKSRNISENREEKVAIESANGFVLLHPGEIDFITRERRKSVVYSKGKAYTVKNTLDELELIFSDYDIFRCHQSYIVPMKKIQSVIQSEFGRSYWAVLECGEKVPVSRGKYPVLKREIEQYGTRFI